LCNKYPSTERQVITYIGIESFNLDNLPITEPKMLVSDRRLITTIKYSFKYGKCSITHFTPYTLLELPIDILKMMYYNSSPNIRDKFIENSVSIENRTKRFKTRILVSYIYNIAKQLIPNIMDCNEYNCNCKSGNNKLHFKFKLNKSIISFTSNISFDDFVYIDPTRTIIENIYDIIFGDYNDYHTSMTYLCNNVYITCLDDIIKKVTNKIYISVINTELKKNPKSIVLSLDTYRISQIINEYILSIINNSDSETDFNKKIYTITYFTDNINNKDHPEIIQKFKKQINNLLFKHEDFDNIEIYYRENIVFILKIKGIPAEISELIISFLI